MLGFDICVNCSFRDCTEASLEGHEKESKWYNFVQTCLLHLTEWLLDCELGTSLLLDLVHTNPWSCFD